MKTADGEPELRLFSNGVGGSPKDLLRQLSMDNGCRTPPEAAPRGEIELSLGLSLGGCFGMDHSPSNVLRRSASITFAPFLQNAAHESGSGAALKRTCSLPAEEPQSWKKRKAENLDGFPLQEEDQADCGFSQGKLEFEKICDDSPRRMNDLSRTGNRIVRIAAVSQGSGVSQGSSSSGFSDLDSQLPQKESARNPNGEDEGFPRPAENGAAAGGGCERTKGMMKEMPCVSTTGKGPNGRRIEGFLYRFRKGEEVRIVCVCHGRFLSPAEFVKHAGGGDVAHPLKHIIVNSPRPCFS